jgi:hypothetical protein
MATGGGAIALALLVCGMVFAAIAGPAESLHTRTQALRQTIGNLGDTSLAVQAVIPLGTLANDIASAGNIFDGGQVRDVTQDQLVRAKVELARGLSAIPLPRVPREGAGGKRHPGDGRPVRAAPRIAPDS